ncbi:MAG: tRNA lysidine(34) synthetase TilS [Chloroflexota bacterium]
MSEAGGLPLSHMTGIEQRLLARARARRIGPDDLIVAGFSGGADSLALACALVRLRARGIGPAVMLVHVDHGLRDESAADAEAAGVLALELGLPFRAMRIGGEALRRHPGVGVEEAARRERYRLLAEACRAVKAVALALAHHRDDQAESVLLHLLRGAGTTGAAGMAELTSRPVPWWSGEPPGAAVAVWRPLLAEPRAALRDLVAARGLAPINDSSNDDRGFARNRIRLDALPALEHAMPGAAAALARYAMVAADEDAALDALAGEALAEATDAAGALRWEPLAARPAAVRRRAARRWLLAAVPGSEPGLDQAEALLAALERNRGGAVVEIGGGANVRIERGAASLPRRGEDGERR